MMPHREPKFSYVMIVDDKQVDVFVVSRLALLSGFCRESLNYTSVTDALEYLKANQESRQNLPEVIFVDIDMPVLSGFDFLDAFDRFSVTLKDHCRVFVLSASLDSNHRSRALGNKNVSGYYDKPMYPEQLDAIPAAR